MNPFINPLAARRVLIAVIHAHQVSPRGAVIRRTPRRCPCPPSDQTVGFVLRLQYHKKEKSIDILISY